MRNKSVLLIVIAGVLWGTSAIFANLLRPLGYTALQMTAMRAIVSAIVMTIYVYIKDKSLFRVKLSHLLLFACGGLATFLSAFFYYESINVSSVSVAVMLMYTAPVFVMAFSVAFMGEKLTPLKVVSVICMLLGCCLISGIVGGVEFNARGVITGLLSGISYSSYNIVAKVQMNKKCNPLSASAYCFIFMAVFAAFSADIPEIFVIASSDPVYVYPLIIGIGIFTVALPYFLYTLALKNIPVGTAAALGIVEPMVATIFGVAFFGDNLTVYSVLGIILILGAVFLLSKSNE